MPASPNLTFEFIGNACGIFTGNKGTRLLCDPWINDGVFEGSWYHYPPLKTVPEDLHRVDAIYLSHIHPDHFDERFFDFDKSIPIIVLDNRFNFLPKKLNELGFHNLVSVKDGETVSLNEFSITLFAPFTKHPFHEAAVGDLIDSAMLIDCNGFRALNTNDNKPTVASCKSLRERFGRIDLAMLNYNGASPYPSKFENLSVLEKKSEHNRILDRNISYMHELIEALEPRMVLPFAGAYILGGKFSYLNEFLGTTTWDACSKRLNMLGLSKTNVICLRENDVLDIETGESNRQYLPVDTKHMTEYIQQISGDKYPYELDKFPSVALIIADLEKASNRMRQRMARADISSDCIVTINVDGTNIQIHPTFSIRNNKTATSQIACTLDLRLLRRILDRVSHWNNAEIGCHIEFNRVPNVYHPDLHTALQFLHL